MNKFLVLAKNKRTYFLRRLIEEVGEGAATILNPWEDRPEATYFERVLVRTSGVCPDTTDLDLLERKFSAVTSVNPLPALRLFRTKKTQYEAFPAFRIPMLPWVDLKAVTRDGLTVFMEKYPHERYIIKPHRGQGGWGVRGLTREELEHWFASEVDREYLLQPLVRGATELRCFFIKDWCLTLERRNPSGGAANFTQGGEARVVATDPEVRALLAQLRKHVPIFYGALDLFRTPDGLITLEINSVPGIEQLERVSGENVMKKLLEHPDF